MRRSWARSRGSGIIFVYLHTVQKFAVISKKFPTTNPTFLGLYMMVTLWIYKKNSNFTRKFAKISNFPYNEKCSYFLANKIGSIVWYVILVSNVLFVRRSLGRTKAIKEAQNIKAQPCLQSITYTLLCALSILHTVLYLHV